jgi:hypothetical protein
VGFEGVVDVSRCVVFVVAVSVLWHTTVGCCAHHGHDEPLGYLGAETHRHAPMRTHAVDHDHECDPAHHNTPDAPCSSDCEGGDCAFAVSTARMSIDLDAPGSGPFLYSNVLDAQASFLSTASADAVATMVPHVSGALARHLALGVLLL